MSIKFCTECGSKNLNTARYCYGCGLCFAEIENGDSKNKTVVSAKSSPTTSSKPQPQVNKKQKQVIIYNDLEDVDDEDGDENGEGKMVIEVDQEFANDFANLVIAKGGGVPNKGVKIEEVINTAKTGENRKVLTRRKNTEAIQFEDIVAVEIKGQPSKSARPTRQSRRK